MAGLAASFGGGGGSSTTLIGSPRYEKFGKGSPVGRWFISLECDSLELTRNERSILMPVLNAIGAEIRRRILDGALGSVAAATVARRMRRDAQAANRGSAAKWPKPMGHEVGGGWATEGERDWRRKKASVNYSKRFQAKRLGRFNPTLYDNSAFGRESGMLGRSIAAGVAPEGGLALFVAGPRGVSRPGNDSALSRIMRRWPTLVRDVLRLPLVQAAVNEAIGGALAIRPKAGGAARPLKAPDVGKALREFGGALEEFAATAEEGSEVE